MAVNWKDTFKIGIIEIDAQHRELFSRLDKLEEALKAGKGNKLVIATFHFLDNYVRLHFRAEEDLQERYHYPHRALHAAEHAAFKKRLEELESRLSTEEPSELLADHTHRLITQWLITHVTSLDTELTQYFNEAKTKQWEKWLLSHF